MARVRSHGRRGTASNACLAADVEEKLWQILCEVEAQSTRQPQEVAVVAAGSAQGQRQPAKEVEEIKRRRRLSIKSPSVEPCRGTIARSPCPQRQREETCSADVASSILSSILTAPAPGTPPVDMLERGTHLAAQPFLQPAPRTRRRFSMKAPENLQSMLGADVEPQDALCSEALLARIVAGADPAGHDLADARRPVAAPEGLPTRSEVSGSGERDAMSPIRRRRRLSCKSPGRSYRRDEQEEDCGRAVSPSTLSLIQEAPADEAAISSSAAAATETSAIEGVACMRGDLGEDPLLGRSALAARLAKRQRGETSREEAGQQRGAASAGHRHLAAVASAALPKEVLTAPRSRQPQRRRGSFGGA
eukprot:TRINITY_DN32714_c0_g1_i1.p1 TRINITY_DN32714_c0_g1~~TRINITY_DN32714_c0_g1_i1.p1  ORF type:complete len:363 (+),score=65.82 TRINITY_DN32714_c0_g1_i1:67-1155(+)